MLEKNPEHRPSIFEILQTPIISEKIRLIVDEFVIGVDIAKKVRQQLVDLDIKLAQSLKIEEIKVVINE